MSDAASIMIYIHDPYDLPKYLDIFRGLGFREIDYCELRRPDEKVIVSYGPCPKLPEENFE